MVERAVAAVCKAVGKPLAEDIIAWSYMDLLERSTQQIKLSVSHKTLDELHPADIADIIEQLDPRLRSQVFAQLDTAQAAEAITELDDDELITEMLEGLSDRDASSMLAMMDPDDAAALIEELDYEKAEKLLRLMGVKEEKAIRKLLGFEEDTAGRIMTSEFVALPSTATVGDAIDADPQVGRGLRERLLRLHHRPRGCAHRRVVAALPYCRRARYPPARPCLQGRGLGCPGSGPGAGYPGDDQVRPGRDSRLR